LKSRPFWISVANPLEAFHHRRLPPDKNLKGLAHWLTAKATIILQRYVKVGWIQPSSRQVWKIVDRIVLTEA
jgi:hypothetical protein